MSANVKKQCVGKCKSRSSICRIEHVSHFPIQTRQIHVQFSILPIFSFKTIIISSDLKITNFGNLEDPFENMVDVLQNAALALSNFQTLFLALFNFNVF